MIAGPILSLLLVATFAAPASAAGFTAVDQAIIDIGCTYSHNEFDAPFLVVLALPPVTDGPRVFLGVDGEDLSFEIEDESEVSSTFRRAGQRLVVHYGAPIEQDCGDDCAGSLRKVRIELDDGVQRRDVEAIEHCGC